LTPESSPKHLEIILGALPENGTLLEIGSGWSTVWFAERLTENQRLVSVEHDKGWWERILPMIVKNKRVDLLLHPPLFPLGPRGTPIRENPAGLSDYIHAFPYQDADVVLIDGVARGPCFVAALFSAESGTNVFVHDAERQDWYAWAWELIDDAMECVLHEPGPGHPAEMLQCRI
jgi:hypothetical protein